MISMMRRFGTLHGGTLALVAAVSAGAVQAGDSDAAREAGRRYGQAIGAASHCPGGKASAKAESMRAAFSGADGDTFQSEANAVIAQWREAMGCREVDPETGRMIVRCRQVKLMSCRQAWVEIGPEGTATPGLIDLSLPQ